MLVRGALATLQLDGAAKVGKVHCLAVCGDEYVFKFNIAVNHMH